MSGHKGDLLVDLLVELERRMLLLQEDSNVLFNFHGPIVSAGIRLKLCF